MGFCNYSAVKDFHPFRKKNVTSLVETKTKLVKIQTAKKKKQEMLAGLSEQVKSVATRNKVVEHQEVDHVDVVAKDSIQKLRE